MKEDFVVYLWTFSLFDHKKLISTDGQSIEIIERGQRNDSSGPDFFNAKIKIDGTLWAGNVEIHTKSSEWLKHNHQKDKAYDNVILHVVWEADIPIKDSNGEHIVALELAGRIAPALYNKYKLLISSSSKIPCQTQLDKIDEFTWLEWKERLLVERLIEKSSILKKIHDASHGDWNQTFFTALCRSFGMKLNQEPFEKLARLTPIKLLEKHKNNLRQLEALLLGQAGFLDEEFSDAYPLELKKIYSFLKKKYELTGVEKHHWKHGGLRPPNFPTIRLAQLAMLIHSSEFLFTKLIDVKNKQDIFKLFTFQPSSYWDTHYVLEKESAKSIKKIGITFINSIIINLMAPIFFLYGDERGEEGIKEKAINILRELGPEKNNITDQWKKVNVPMENASDSQALIQLYNIYCKDKKCLKCKIGAKLLALK